MHRGESIAVQDVVLGFTQSLVGKGHHITMDNFFTLIPLFIELVGMQIYATGTVCSNCVELPLALRNVCSFRRSP